MLLAWCVALPLWFGEGIRDEKFPFIASAMMFTPTVAALVVTLAEGRGRSFIRDVGLWPFNRPKRLVLALVLAYLVPIFLIVQAPVIGTWLGVFPGDLENFAVLHFVAGGEGPGRYLLGQAGLILVAGLVNTIFALGEEIGWRGWLWNRLSGLGQIQAILISGVIWGLWHAPLVLLGYNYPFATGVWGVVTMCGMCTIFGAFLGWLRTLSSSVWPAALAHGVFNAGVGLVGLFLMMGAPLNTMQASIMGWSGWILPVVIILAMAKFSAFKTVQPVELSTDR